MLFRSWLVRLLVVMLSPVLVVLTPTTARAVVYSDPVPVAFGFDSPAPGVWGKCNASGYYAESQGAVSGRIKFTCTWGWQIDDNAERHVRVSLEGERTGGGTCSVPNAIDTAAASGVQQLALVAFPVSDCHVKSFCWEMIGEENSGFFDYTGSGCGAWDWGPPPGSERGECAAFWANSPTVRKVQDGQRTNSQGQIVHDWHIEVDVPGNTKVPYLDSQFQVAAVYTDNRAGESGAIQMGFPGGTTGFKNLVRDPGTSTSWGYSTPQINGASFGELSAYTIVGVQLRHQGIGGTFTNALPQNNVSGDVGTTVPANCFMYFGEPVAVTPNDDFDIPAGPILGSDREETEPDGPGSPEDSNVCGFSWSDPSGWATAGICALVELIAAVLDVLGSIFAALGDLIAAVAGLVPEILDGLRALFIPDAGYFDGKTAQLRADLDATQPGAYVTAFTDQDYGFGSGGCGGINADWTIAGKSFSFDFLDACSGFMASTASVVKLAATVLLVIFGAVGCLRGLGAGFNWSPSMGREGASA